VLKELADHKVQQDLRELKVHKELVKVLKGI
jgi:hypothetical protein